MNGTESAARTNGRDVAIADLLDAGRKDWVADLPKKPVAVRKEARMTDALGGERGRRDGVVVEKRVAEEKVAEWKLRLVGETIVRALMSDGVATAEERATIAAVLRRGLAPRAESA
jgi:hypothetical protein